MGKRFLAYIPRKGIEMSENTRKAVVTTAQVQEALKNYNSVRANLAGLETPDAQEFDKGARGKGFATYNADGSVDRPWETKDEALSFYSTWTQVANDVIKLQAFKANAPKKVAAKVVKGSEEGDAKSA
jgi:hypothetical protein